MKTKTEHISIPLADYLRLNDHGLLDSCNELEHWIKLLDFLADFMQVTEFHTRGSCIALATLRWIGELPLPENDELEIKHALVPYTTFSEIHRRNPELDVNLSPKERKLYELIIHSAHKKNIDIYLNLADPSEIQEVAQELSLAFNDFHAAQVVALEVLPNGIAALTVEVKGGYVDHEVVIALKPPLQKDLRKQASRRQKAARGTISKATDMGWKVCIETRNADSLAQSDEFEFLKQESSLIELLLYLLRAIRFNCVYPSKNQSLQSEIVAAVQKISELLTHENTLEPSSETQRFLLVQIMNEAMIAFLHNPSLMIQLLLLLPEQIFPLINRSALRNNQDLITAFLSRKPEGYFETPQENHVHLSHLILWLTSCKDSQIEHMVVPSDYQNTIDSLDAKIRMTETIEQFDTHSTWYFPKYTDYYLLQLLFQPILLL